MVNCKKNYNKGDNKEIITITIIMTITAIIIVIIIIMEKNNI